MLPTLKRLVSRVAPTRRLQQTAERRRPQRPGLRGIEKDLHVAILL